MCDKDGIRFIHVPAGLGNVTIAYRFDGGGKVSVGMSFCAPTERHYDRKKGNLIAKGRLETNPLRFDVTCGAREELGNLLRQFVTFPWSRKNFRDDWKFDNIADDSTFRANVGGTDYRIQIRDWNRGSWVNRIPQWLRVRA